ncbi:ABC transporter ATP-binding protein [Lichenifustis flavocetrariae]|uniref:ABC transporter ATP-binding protein n=1 Tax=Lichenifustis flavocetrariae TaxID=2949735 RepID=A0AA42CJD0_9HYPH|nr:ABC transporter ATP-binding protein [Lichenifustis flavocetrariae]MCW6509453.1 ABC transporter ATP-binding protein [Lichenifustis flavocetrariae]
MSTITIEHVSKRYGDKLALDDVSLNVHSGELIALLGSSGCGKTTLLRAIAGLIDPSAGRILFDGRDVTAVPTRMRPIGMVFQSYSLFPNMTVRQNIAFPLKVRGQSTAAIARRVDELLALIGLGEWADRHPSQLSGGQQQRTALARALAPDPAVLLLDEPLSALDAVVRLHLRDEIRRIQQSIRTTALLVTHDQSEALAVADRVVVMRQGRIEQLATPASLYETPTTAFSASFIGNRNALNLPVRDGRIRLCGTIEIATALTTPRALVFVRSEDVRRSNDASGQAATIENRIFEGSTTRFYLTIPTDDGPLHVKADWPSRETDELRSGDTINVVIDPRDAHVFPG